MKYANLFIPVPLNEEFTYIIPDNLIDDVMVGKRVIVPFARSEKTGYVVSISDTYTGEYKLKEIKRVIDKETVFNQELIDLSIWMSKLYLTSKGLILDNMIPSGRRESANAIFPSSIDEFNPIEKLSDEQIEAIDAIDITKNDMYYLFGVTGSGKSEVYLRVSEKVIKEGGQVIYLVPEITLTHQLKEDILNRFKDRVAILHSGLTPSERLKQWRDIINGDVDIIIGARSAIFAPTKKLGLIIIDEEHETSYKSGNSPRYHARQVAQNRASENNVPLIMGSATPSLEAYQMMEEKKVKRLNLNSRVAGGAMPEMEVVSMLKEKTSISKRLEDEIRKKLNNKRGVILFLNRRGHTYYYHCSHCGHVITCPHCSVALTYHKKENKLSCHCCGYSEPLVRECPECKMVSMNVKGFGTELVEEEVKTLFPFANVARLDTDIAKTSKKAVETILKDFKNGKIDILLGTQMVAKGLNFPSVSLIGIIMADSTLSIPDFRARENTFSLLLQVAGRAGRYTNDGKVIIQTYRKEDRAIQDVLNNRVREFYKEELRERKEIPFPPFTRLIEFTFRSKNEEKVRQASQDFYDLLTNIIESIKNEKDRESLELLGCSKCVIEKMSDNFRYHVLLSGKKINLALNVANAAINNFNTPSSVYLEVDVDPLSLL